MKKEAQIQPLVDAKVKETQAQIAQFIKKMNDLLKQPQPNLKEISNELNNSAAEMARVVNQKIIELKSLVPTTPPKTSGGAAASDHLSPRYIEDNKNLPEFWRKNFDYGESPYMHMDKINTITKKPVSKRIKKKRKK